MRRNKMAMLLVAACSILLGGVFGAACNSKAKTEEVVNHTHEYDLSNWESDGKFHWHKTICGHDVRQKFRHDYDDDSDEQCNTCGYIRIIDLGEDKPSQDNPNDNVDNPNEDEDNPSEGDNNASEGEDTPNDVEDNNPSEGDNNNPNDNVEKPNEDEDKPSDGGDKPNDGDNNNPNGDEDNKPNDGDNNPPEEEPTLPEGYIVDKNADGLDAAFRSTRFVLDRENASVDIATGEIVVYLKVNGERREAVPSENLEWKIYRNGVPTDEWTGLTEEGDYTLTVTVIDAYYSDGTAVESDRISAAIAFSIENPVTELRLTAGTVVQTASPTDKMSAGWLFEAVRANGETMPVTADKVTIEALDTQTAGTHTAHIAYGGVTGTVEYTIAPRPEIIKSVEVSLKDSVDTTVVGDYLTLGIDDFNVSVNADGAYSLSDSWLIYAGQFAKSINLPPQEELHIVTVRTVFEYTVDGDKVIKECENEVAIAVKKPPQPAPPQETVGNDILIDDALMDNLPAEIFNQTVASSASGSVTVMGAADYTVRVEECGKTIDGESYTNAITVECGETGDPYSGFKFSIKESATVRLKISATSESGFAMLGVEKLDESGAYNLMIDEYGYLMCDDYGATYEFVLDSGDYDFVFLGEYGVRFNIHSFEMIFG